MATITLTVPNPIAQRVTDAMCARFGYQATIDGQPNPQTKAEFMKSKIIEWVKSQVKEHESNTAAATAAIAAGTDVDTNINIT